MPLNPSQFQGQLPPEQPPADGPQAPDGQAPEAQAGAAGDAATAEKVDNCRAIFFEPQAGHADGFPALLFSSTSNGFRHA